jgi:hypothetical protein
MLKPFVTSTGGTNYLSLMRVPSSERLPELAKKGRVSVHKILAAQIEFMMKYFNLKQGLSLDQIFILADLIIDESEADNLSLQDVYLFLHKLATGKMGPIYQSLDIPRFMELFQIHRDERIEALQAYRDEEHAQFKGMGDSDRWSKENNDREKELNREALADYLKATYKNK